MDLETLMAKNAVISGQLDKAVVVIDRYEEKIKELDEEIDILAKKSMYAEQNEITMKGIMVQNITESNAEKQRLLGEIQELKGVLRQLRNK